MDGLPSPTCRELTPHTQRRCPRTHHARRARARAHTLCNPSGCRCLRRTNYVSYLMGADAGAPVRVASFLCRGTATYLRVHVRRTVHAAHRLLPRPTDRTLGEGTSGCRAVGDVFKAARAETGGA